LLPLTGSLSLRERREKKEGEYRGIFSYTLSPSPSGSKAPPIWGGEEGNLLKLS